MNPAQANVVVVLFTIQGCGACASMKPRFKRLAERYQQHYPIYMLDANDPRYAELANRLNVQGVPATFVLRKPTGLIRVEGEIPDDQIEWILNVAAREAHHSRYY